MVDYLKYFKPNSCTRVIFGSMKHGQGRYKEYLVVYTYVPTIARVNKRGAGTYRSYRVVALDSGAICKATVSSKKKKLGFLLRWKFYRIHLRQAN